MDLEALCEVYDEANSGSHTIHSTPQDTKKEQVDNSPSDDERGQKHTQMTSRRASRTKKEEAPAQEQESDNF